VTEQQIYGIFYVALGVLAVARLALTLATALPLRLRRSALDTVDNFLGALLVVMFIIRPFIVEAYSIPSGSMRPTLRERDRILACKFIYRLRAPRRGEVVVFRAPPQARSPGRNLIKRVIGLPGEVVEVRDGKVYINGKPLEEPYILEPPYYEFGPYRVPEGCVFVMGDNRNDSLDSHIWGPLPIRNILGKAMVIWWPPWRVGFIR